MKIYAIFDEYGLPLGFYTSEIHGANTPVDAVEITGSQWKEFLDNQGARKWQDGRVVEYTPPTPEPQPVVTILPAVTLWERLTEDEADRVNEAMATQSVRTQRIFTTANTFRSDHELWPLLEQMATELFGAERAAQLLADQ
ncbi:hypothetical protein [Brucella pituitosa]|uniref:hypothetical protein n=1 Tax=Brucella pituitosa TaxID=571256 RepID=UPI001FFEB8CA|nr:hypothetical protein [Brucella pituitosa]